MTSSRSLPPAIVLGIDTPIGLTVVRELGEHGVEVHGLAWSRDAVGLYSRRLHKGYIRPRSLAETAALINSIRQDSGASILLTISETDALFVRNAADRGELPGLNVLVPGLDKLRLVQDKAATCRIAESIGIPVPATWEPASPDDAKSPPPNLTFPCVLKWRDPHSVSGALAAARLRFLKSEYCYTRDELTRTLARYEPVLRYPLVQSFCPGSGLGQMFFMHNGRALLRFQHRRLAEWPPEGGFSTVCQSVSMDEHPDLLSKSEELLRRIGWEGAAMVEYRHDPATGKAALMEINGRFWGSLPLAYHAGAYFAWLTYAVLGNTAEAKPGPYRAGVTCRYMVPETKRVLTVCLNRRAIQDRNLEVSPAAELWRYLSGFLAPRMRYYVFTWRDPRPFIADLSGMIVKATKALAGLGRTGFARIAGKRETG